MTRSYDSGSVPSGIESRTVSLAVIQGIAFRPHDKGTSAQEGHIRLGTGPEAVVLMRFGAVQGDQSLAQAICPKEDAGCGCSMSVRQLHVWWP